MRVSSPQAGKTRVCGKLLAGHAGNKESTLSLRAGRPPRLEIRNTCKVGSCQLLSKGQQLREHARDGKRGDVDVCHPLNCKNIPYAVCDFHPGWEKGTCQDCSDTRWHCPKYAQRININRNSLCLSSPTKSLETSHSVAAFKRLCSLSFPTNSWLNSFHPVGAWLVFFM